MAGSEMAGVSAATGAMVSLLGKLTDLLSDEYNLLASVRKKIQFLERELSSMRDLLQKMADMEEKLDAMAKDWRGKVRDLSYELEDCIDRFMDQLGSGDAKPKFMKRTARRLKTLWARHAIATQIEELKSRVVEESERRGRYKQLDESYYAPTRTVEIDPRITALHEEVRDLVAMDGPMKHVTALLTDVKEMELKVVAIVGSGGLGKTTLAMEVYRKIGRDFQCQASVSVSRTIDLAKLLKDILSQIDKHAFTECQSEGWEIQQLIPKIKHILIGKRYFIVIDDVWREKDWKLVKAAFPENNNGSRIVATTRISGVANSCCYNSSGQPYHMAHLDDVDSRRLFFKRVFRSDDPCPHELAEVSTGILKKCGGLPLAIVTFASLLANKTRNKNEWERLQDSIGIGSSLETDGNLKGMKDILLLSYWDLPHHLKTCLLYLSTYPEDYEIECEKLKLKWIAEGFLDRWRGRLDQAANDCFNELVNRNMIQPSKVEDDGSVTQCRVHDMVLDLIVSLSDEENFATLLNGRTTCNNFPSKIRRLSMQSSGKQHTEVIRAITGNKSHVRSLTMFWPVEQIPALVDFPALRVLHLDMCYWLENKHVKHIGSLRQLRYLRINSPRITELPGEIGRLHHLQTLDLGGCFALVRLPSTVVQLKKLVRLLVSRNTCLPAGEFGRMQALEVLEDLNISKSDNPARFAEQLGQLTELRKLHMVAAGERAMDSATRKETTTTMGSLVSSVSKLGGENLRYLHTVDPELCEGLFWDPGCTYPNLQDLTISVPVEMVPRGMASLGNLVKLCIAVREFDKAGLHLLMGMPSLAHLKLEITRAIKEKLTVCSNGFRLLKVFHYKYWHFEEGPADGMWVTFAPGSVPALRRLHFKLNPMEVSSDFLAEMGVDHLSGLAHLQVEIDSFRAGPGQVEALESFIEKAIDSHPNREMKINVIRYSGGDIFNNDKGWEEAVAQRKKEMEEHHQKLEKKG